MTEKILNLLGLMRRANAITIGEDKTAEIVRAGKAKLLLLSSDASENAVRKAENLANGRNVQLLHLPFDRAELGSALGIGGCSVSTVTDIGFASAWMKLLATQWPEQFASAAQAVESRREKAARRKSQKGSKREGTRRTNG